MTRSPQAVGLIGLSLLIGFVSACSQPTPHADPYPNVAELSRADRYYRQRQPDEAIKLVRRYLENTSLTDKQRAGALTLLGDIYYSLQQFESAARMFEQALARTPDSLQLRDRSWKVRLVIAPGKQTRARIRTEISELLADTTTVDQLLTAYGGYAYLWDSAGRRRILDRLVSLPSDRALPDDFAYLLLEELIQTDSRAEIENYGLHFLRRYPDHVNMPLVVNYLFRGLKGTPRLDSLLPVLEQLSAGNPYLQFRIAEYRLSKTGAHRAATRRIDALVALADADRLHRCSNPGELVTCRYYRARLIGELYTLQATMLARNNDLDRALRYAQLATRANDTSARAWSQQARLLQRAGRHAEAVSALVRALNLRPDARDSRALWSRLQQQQPRDDGIESGRLRFTDVTATTGLNRFKAQRAAWGDINNDGYDDLVLSGPRLLLNRSGHTFTDITRNAGLDPRLQATGGLLVDFDNDGRVDLLVSGKQTVLYRNIGGNRFREFKRFNTGDNRRTAAASWGDFDNDGYPDLYLANYERPAPHRGLCHPDQLFINNRGKSFTEKSELLEKPAPYPLCGRGVAWSDLDRDSRAEIIVSNYRLQPNSLFRFSAGDELTDLATDSGYQGELPGHSIAAVAADFNGDGEVDLYQTNLAHPRYLHLSSTSQLLLNTGNKNRLQFKRRRDTGIAFDETNADVSTADFDNDGDLDLFITSIYPGRFSSLYLNDGHGRFRNVSWASNTQVENSWGVATADYDNDGDVDLLVASEDGIRLLRNELPGVDSLTVSVDSRRCQRNGLGMKLWLTAGAQTWYREVQAGKGTGTQDSARIVFGLGGHAGPVEVRALDSCGHRRSWSGSSSQGRVILK